MGLFTRIKRSSTSSSAASTAPNSGSSTPVTTTNTLTSTISSSPTTKVLSTSSTFPTPLTKSSSRLGFTKTLTWGKKSQEEKYRQRIESWEKEDENEWAAPSARKGHGKGRKLVKKDLDMLRAFEWRVCERSSLEGGRSRSAFSGISPGCSRMPSVDFGSRALGESGLRREESESSSSSSESSEGSTG